MVTVRWSVHLTTLILPRLEQADNRYLAHILFIVTDNKQIIRERERERERERVREREREKFYYIV